LSSPWQKYKESIAYKETELIQTSPNIDDFLEKIDVEVSENRLKICRKCPELVTYTSQCSQCGCFMPSKVEFKSSSCPLGKW
jgi:hypothetical protein